MLNPITRTISLSDVAEFFKKIDISLTRRQITIAYSYCKMTVVDEMNEAEKLEKLEFVEFLEFIGRIACMIFDKNETMKLYDKIFLTLQKLFEVIPAEAKEPESELNAESESDNDEYMM